MDHTTRNSQPVTHNPSLDIVNPNQIEILIVEDNPVQALQLHKLLGKNGYEVSVACNGVEALSYLQEHRPSMVISDIIMPEMDGYELCSKIKAHDDMKSIPVLLLTALSDPEDIIKGLECGADNFITKPYDRELLMSRIQYILVNQEIRKGSSSQIGIEFFFAGNKHFINSNRLQILDLLFASFENALQQQRKLESVNKELNGALKTIKILSGMLPMCANCKKIRDENDQWLSLETYISRYSEATFSHGLCPECVSKMYLELEEK